jgi:anti-sigma B factor antagonist
VAIEIGRREREGIVILDLQGRITAGEESGEVRDQLRQLAAAGTANVILNLQEVDYIDSTGLGALVMGHTALRKAGGRLTLEHLNEPQMELLVLTKLSTVFDSYSDEQQAVNSFFPDRQIQRFDILSFVKDQVGD